MVTEQGLQHGRIRRGRFVENAATAFEASTGRIVGYIFRFSHEIYENFRGE